MGKKIFLAVTASILLILIAILFLFYSSEDKNQDDKLNDSELSTEYIPEEDIIENKSKITITEITDAESDLKFYKVICANSFTGNFDSCFSLSFSDFSNSREDISDFDPSLNPKESESIIQSDCFFRSLALYSLAEDNSSICYDYSMIDPRLNADSETLSEFTEFCNFLHNNKKSEFNSGDESFCDWLSEIGWDYPLNFRKYCTAIIMRDSSVCK